MGETGANICTQNVKRAVVKDELFTTSFRFSFLLSSAESYFKIKSLEQFILSSGKLNLHAFM